MIEKISTIFLAILIAVGITPMLTLSYAQAQDNATATTNTTTTTEETNATIPVEISQLPIFPEASNETQPESAANQTQSKDNASKVIGLLDDAQVKIDEARNLIRAIQAQIEADRQSDSETTTTNETGEIIESGNESATDIIDIINDTDDTEAIEDVGNATDDITDAIEDSIESNSNATADAIQNATDEVIEVIDNATDNLDNATIEVAIDNAMVRLLSGLVAAQDYNGGLSGEERDELKTNLQDAIAELASDAAEAVG